MTFKFIIQAPLNPKLVQAFHRTYNYYI